MIILFQPDGTAKALYSEKIDLRALGTLTMKRASDIQFNEASQEWVVYRANKCTPLFSHASRARCLKWEAENAELLLQ